MKKRRDIGSPLFVVQTLKIKKVGIQSTIHTWKTKNFQANSELRKLKII
jgi:hypothetical protein